MNEDMKRKKLNTKATKKKGPLAVRIFAICALLVMLIPAGVATYSTMDGYFHPSAVSVSVDKASANQNGDSIVKLNEDGTQKDNPNLDNEPQ